MKIFITGAGGFIGRHLIPKLKDHELICFTRRKHEHLKDVRTIEGDLKFLGTFQHLFQGVDMVIHLAANLWKDDNMYKDNVVGTKNLIEVCKQYSVSRLIYISSKSATEDNTTEYGKTKLQAENLIKNYSGLDYTILKPTMVYGDGGRGFKRITNHIKKYPITPIVGHGNTLMQPVYIQDVINVILECIKNPISINKTYNVAGPKPVTMNYLFDKISEAMGKKKPKIHVPLKAIYLLNKFRKKKMTKEGIKTFYKDSSLDISETIKDLKYNPISLEEGLKLVFI